MAKFKGNRCIPTAEGKWDKTKEYLGLSVVLDEKTGDSYTSKKVVPSGTELTNKDYWALSGQYNAQMALIKLQLEAMQKIPEGGTTADAALENIRIAADGTEYATPGDAVRGQIGALSEEIDYLTEPTRNIANLTNVVIGKAQNTSTNSGRACLFIPVLPNEKYTISFNDISNFEAVYWYQKTEINAIKAVSEGIVTNKLILTMTSTTNILCIQFNKTNVSYNDFKNLELQVEKGNITTGYIRPISCIDVFAREMKEDAFCDYVKSCDISTFSKCLCIGDSLTAGTFNHNDSGSTLFEVYPKYSYPTYLTKLTGIETVNKGIGGKKSSEWYDLMKDIDLSGFDMCIIQLGVNDALKLGNWTTETKTALQNIITKVRNENKNIKIFVSTIIPNVAYNGDSYDRVSTGIRNLVAEYNSDDIILTDLANYGHTNDDISYNCGHLSAYGYHRLAEDYKNIISYLMVTNKDKFRQIQFIGTDYSYH